MRIKLTQILSLVTVTAVICGEQACSPVYEQSSDQSSFLAGNVDSISIFSQTLQPLLKSNCGSCHGVNQVPMFAVTDPAIAHATVINSGLADLTTPSNSRFVGKIQSGHSSMPTTLAPQLQAAIQDWATQLQSLGGSLPPPPVLTPTFQSISALILVPKCVGCHGPTRADNGVRYDTYQLTKNTVRATPAQSKLYTECASGSMPDKAPNLTSLELAAISQWITDGALDN